MHVLHERLPCDVAPAVRTEKLPPSCDCLLPEMIRRFETHCFVWVFPDTTQGDDGFLETHASVGTCHYNPLARQFEIARCGHHRAPGVWLGFVNLSIQKYHREAIHDQEIQNKRMDRTEEQEWDPEITKGLPTQEEIRQHREKCPFKAPKIEEFEALVEENYPKTEDPSTEAQRVFFESYLASRQAQRASEIDPHRNALREAISSHKPNLVLARFKAIVSVLDPMPKDWLLKLRGREDLLTNAGMRLVLQAFEEGDLEKLIKGQCLTKVRIVEIDERLRSSGCQG